MLVDEVDIILKGGHGGAGKVSFYPKEKAGPDGGNGGKGGDLYIKTVSDLTALNQYSNKKFLAAENGQKGGTFLKFGRNGKDMVITMPVGTTLIEKESGEKINLDEVEQVVLVAKGGLGGRGNADFKSSRNTTPRYAQPGLPGEEKHFEVVLQLIADFGLIGLPNTGKSSLLNELTSANIKTAEYPFTTLEPNLGVTDGKILADIPGLIAGASEGKGLGIKFLKHIEKVETLLHCITVDSPDVVGDYETVWKEMEAFSREIRKKKEIIIITKTDLADPEAVKEKERILKKFKKQVVSVSIHDWDSLKNLKKVILS